MNCLTDATLGELVDGRLAAEALERVHLHAAGCADCRGLLAAVTRSGMADTVRSGSTEQDLGLSPPGATWAPPARFEEFVVDRMLGRGGMGVVYLAKDTKLEREVALKFIASRPEESSLSRALEAEARALARLQHPNVVSVFRAGEIAGHSYIVSEYVAGTNLAAIPVPVPWRRALTLGVGLARGLAAAHHQGVLHRDLKPSNAILSESGEVKLFDFGLAEQFDPQDGTRAGRPGIAGTPRYMPPEIRLGRPATPRADVYSLGVILFELCTGQLPPPLPAAPPLSLGEGVDPDFVAVVLRCLAPEPAHRFASGEAACEALERIERGYHIIPLAAGNPYPGLAPFEAERQAVFFGRDPEIRAVLERLARLPMVLVTGDSGVGKSSLCRAGVLPRAAAGALEDGRQLTTLTLSPGRRPLDALASSLAPVLRRREAWLASELTQSPAAVSAALRDAHQAGRGVLLFVDQLEELLTSSDPAQAQQFARFLGELALPAPGVRVLLAARGDYLTGLRSLPGLGDHVRQALFMLRYLPSERVRLAIVGPARAQGVSFESEELISALLESTRPGKGGLPLLQFALSELWERRDRQRDLMTQSALEEMGGVAGALTRHADSVLAGLGDAERAAVRNVLLLLVADDGTVRELQEEHLSRNPDSPEGAAVRSLVAGRLVIARTGDGRPRYRIAHEALIRSWGTLRTWLEQSKEQRAMRERVETACAEWERVGRVDGRLWDTLQLAEVRTLDSGALGPPEREFLAASRRAVRRARWRRWLVALAAALAAGALGALWLRGAA